MREESLEQELEARVEALGYELIELERAGSRTRPVLRLRIDVPGGVPGRGVTLDDCAQVSRSLEPYLESREDVAERYVLEVSSPGVERPLVRRRDWDRFVGHGVALKGERPLADRSRRLEGELLGVEGSGVEERIRLRLEDGSEVAVPREDVSRAHLVYRWEDAG